jgi:predicted RNA-binding protein YlxR (DUF448 family)
MSEPASNLAIKNIAGGNSKKKVKTPRPKHIPERMCVACRSHKPKRDLVRVVRTTESQAEVDTTGKKNGRGAYLCAVKECWEIGLTKKALDRELEITIDSETRAKLKAYGESLPERSAVAME